MFSFLSWKVDYWRISPTQWYSTVRYEWATSAESSIGYGPLHASMLGYGTVFGLTDRRIREDARDQAWRGRRRFIVLAGSGADVDGEFLIPLHVVVFRGSELADRDERLGKRVGHGFRRLGVDRHVVTHFSELFAQMLHGPPFEVGRQYDGCHFTRLIALANVWCLASTAIA